MKANGVKPPCGLSVFIVLKMREQHHMLLPQNKRLNLPQSNLRRSQGCVPDKSSDPHPEWMGSRETSVTAPSSHGDACSWAVTGSQEIHSACLWTIIGEVSIACSDLNVCILKSFFFFFDQNICIHFKH